MGIAGHEAAAKVPRHTPVAAKAPHRASWSAPRGRPARALSAIGGCRRHVSWSALPGLSIVQGRDGSRSGARRSFSASGRRSFFRRRAPSACHRPFVAGSCSRDRKARRTSVLHSVPTCVRRPTRAPRRAHPCREIYRAMPCVNRDTTRTHTTVRGPGARRRETTPRAHRAFRRAPSPCRSSTFRHRFRVGSWSTLECKR